MFLKFDMGIMPLDGNDLRRTSSCPVAKTSLGSRPHPIFRVVLAFQETRGAVVAVGRAFAAMETVVEPAVCAPHRVLCRYVGIAMLHFAQARVLVHGDPPARQSGTIQHAGQGIAGTAER